MNKKALISSTLGLVVLLAVTSASAQSSAYFKAMTNLNPAGYWPMHEVEAAAPGDIETNYGTLGLLGTAYYPDWADGSIVTLVRGAAGALGGDSDAAVRCKVLNNGSGLTPATANVWTNQLYVPHTSPWATLNPPFTVELWYYPTGFTQTIFGQYGDNGLNQGGAGTAAGAFAGTELTLSGAGKIAVTVGYNGVATGIITATAAVPTNFWYHLVYTCDASTNFTLYTNGVLVGATVAGVGKYTPDYWSPMMIGGDLGGKRSCGGVIDEFAVYTNVLPDVAQHYTDGTNTAPATSYFHDVTNDNPVIYLRMDATPYVVPALNTWPALTNYGKTNGVAVNSGVYSPGTMPGLLTNVIVNPNGLPYAGVSNTVAAFSGVSSFADAGYAPAYDPTGSNGFSVTALFRGNPCDGRVQTIAGHSDNSWRIYQFTNGPLQCQLGTNTDSLVKSAKTYNDGNWHQVVEVYTPASNPNVPGTNALYVDGVLDNSVSTVTTNGIQPGTNLDVMIASDPQYTNNFPGLGRQFAGQVCEVAIFTNALTPLQIQTLYSNCQVAPYITVQPVNGGALTGGAGTYTNLSVTAVGSPSLAYNWYSNSASSYSGATKLANGVKYTNATTSQLTITNLGAGDNAYYFVVVSNSFGSVTSAPALLTVYVAPSIISQSPVTYTNLFSLYAGASPAFNVSVVGATPITYRWFTNGVLDGAATSSNLALANLPIGSITNYFIASNTIGTGTSMVWTASVIADPTNSAGGLAPYPQAVLALNPIGYWRLNEPDDLAFDGNNGAIALDYAGGNDGVYTNVILSNLGYNPVTDPGDTSVQVGNTAADNDAFAIAGVNFGSPTNTSVAFTVEAWVNGAAQTLDAGIVTLGYLGAEQFSLDTSSDTAPTSHGFRFSVRGASGAQAIVASTIMPSSGVWYHLVGVCDEVNSNIAFYINGRLAGTAAIAPGSGLLASSQLMTIGARGTSSVSGNDLQFNGYINDVAVYKQALTANQVAIQYVQSGNVAPFFTLPPPTNVTVGGYSTLIIPAMAAGTTNLGYTWYDVNGGTNVATGTTNGLPLNATLTVSNVPWAWSGEQLELTVTNFYGTTNVFVTITVFTNAPAITQNLPANVTVPTGNPYTYSIAVTGPTPYGYQWYNVSSPVANQTNPTYTVTAGSPGSTTYYVVITNVFGATTSTVSTFKSVALQITQDLPASVNVLSGKSYAYSIGVAGATPVGYQWFNVSSPVANQTNSTYAATAGSPGSSTTYYVVITNINGGVTSSVSTLNSISQLTNSFATELLSFNPAGYWPMHEVEAAAPGDIETNYGSLGLLGTGFYPDWASGNNTAISRSHTGALAGDSDQAVWFTQPGGANVSGGTTNFLSIPRTSPLTTWNPPFSVECWYYPTNTGGAGQGDIWSQSGWEGLNAGASGNGDGNVCGTRLYWGGSGFIVYTYYNNSALNTMWGSVNVAAAFMWHHVVITCDAATNFTMYVDGSLAEPTVSALLKYTPDYWSPFEVGSGRGNTRPGEGLVDEVAVYTNLLATNEIAYHYFIGTNASPLTNYFTAVTNDNPTIYLRMDAPVYTVPSVGQWPELFNYGSVGNPGVYSPGTMPGIVNAGTNFVGLSGTNVAQLSGVSSFADAGYASAYDPVGAVPFSVTAMFRGNPCDNRIQTIVGHSGNSWAITMTTAGQLLCQLGTNSSGALTSVGVYNDGNWHQVTEVYSPVAATHYLYVDGALDTSVAVSALGISPGSALHVMIASDPQYTNSPGGEGRQFAGQVCEVAVFTNALTATQVQQIYTTAVSGPSGTPTISLVPSGNNVVITYAGTLLSSTNVIGPYNPVGGASSPYTTPATNAQLFYRSSNP